MPLVQTRGAASAQGFGEFAQVTAVNYIEDVFSTYLHTGTGAALTITNSIDLSTKGGLVWCKARSVGNHGRLFDTARGVQKAIYSSLTSGEATESTALTAFNADGFTLGSNDNINGSGATNVSWTFREQAKFFDVVTYTGDGTTKAISHNLGSTPGCIIVKSTSVADDWFVYHRSLSDNSGNPYFLKLNTTATPDTGGGAFGTPTSTTFTVRNGTTNTSGATYVAYLFAHNAGGFGLTGSDNVISCGSYTGNGTAGNAVTLGFEPQFVMIKRTDSTGNWFMQDIMRGIPNAGSSFYLYANTSDAETDGGVPTVIPTATGFTLPSFGGWNASGGAYIYIAIRRGPMKVPTTGTSVFQPVTYSGNGSNDRLVNTTITPDLFIDMRRDNTMPRYVLDRLRGNGRLYSNLTNAESSNTAQIPANTFNVNQTGVTVSADEVNASGRTFVLEAFRRAPGFFDEVCYTGNGTAGRTVSHNLAAVPELIIGKTRDGAIKWTVYSAPVGNTAALFLNLTDTPETGSYFWNNTSPTSTNFTLGDSAINNNTVTAVAYLFATCAGVSKVGSYTGTGTTQTINCGFTAGARFVLIKRTDSTGDWYVWDSARGIVAGNDPYLLLNSTAAEVTNTDYVDTANSGFEISSTAPAAINANGGTYIFLAIA